MDNSVQHPSLIGYTTNAFWDMFLPVSNRKINENRICSWSRVIPYYKV